MKLTAWRLRTAILAAVGAATALFGLPSPQPPAPAGPPTLAGVWPSVRTIDVPAVMPDGSAFEPALVLDATTVLGTTTAADNDIRLVALSAADPTHPRLIQALGDTGSVSGVTAEGGRAFWMTGVADADGDVRTLLYRFDPADSTPRVVTGDTGDAAYYGSQYDLQVAAGRIWWTATRDTEPVTSELRSVAVDGGPVTVRPLPGEYAMTAWPWLTSMSNTVATPVQQLNVETGRRRTIGANPGEQLTCSPVWCRAVVYGERSAAVTLRRLDGGAATRINAEGEEPAAIDVASLDRFEVLTAQLSVQQASTTQKVALYDLKRHQHIAVAVAAAVGNRGGWLWWCTGTNETSTWHLLNLAALR